MNNLLNLDTPLSDSEKIAELMKALLISQNCLELAKNGDLPPHIARAAWESVCATFEKVKL